MRENLLSEEDFNNLVNFANVQGPELESDPQFSPRFDFWLKAARTVVEKVKTGEITPQQAERIVAATLASKERREEIDFLTGLYNRRGFEVRLEAEMERAKRATRPLSIAFMDLDKFKDINDTYGHPVGDVVLKTWSAYLKSSLRIADIIGRLGGEEVVAILPETDEQNGFRTFDRLRVNMPEILAVQLKDTGIKRSITMSVGIAEYRLDESAIQFLTRADERVYKAKELGRNKVIAS